MQFSAILILNSRNKPSRWLPHPCVFMCLSMHQRSIIRPPLTLVVPLQQSLPPSYKAFQNHKISVSQKNGVSKPHSNSLKLHSSAYPNVADSLSISA